MRNRSRNAKMLSTQLFFLSDSRGLPTNGTHPLDFLLFILLLLFFSRQEKSADLNKESLRSQVNCEILELTTKHFVGNKKEEVTSLRRLSSSPLPVFANSRIQQYSNTKREGVSLVIPAKPSENATTKESPILFLTIHFFFQQQPLFPGLLLPPLLLLFLFLLLCLLIEISFFSSSSSSGSVDEGGGVSVLPWFYSFLAVKGKFRFFKFIVRRKE